MAKDFYNNLDLNLLRIFLVIYQEKNLQKASLVLFVSPPALSKSLSRLRDHFDDPLFVKVPKGLRATPFAVDLNSKITPIFHSLSNDINSLRAFEPNELSGIISIAISPFLLQALGKDLFFAVNQQAPNVELHLVNWSRSSLEDIATGVHKLGINYELPLSRKNIISHELSDDMFKIYARKSHPLASSGSTVKVNDIAKYPLAILIAADWNLKQSYAEQIIRELDVGFEPKIAFRSELPSAIMEAVAETDLLFPSSSLLDVEQYPNLCAISAHDANQKMLKKISVFYHQKDNKDPTQKWLVDIVSKLVQQKACRF